MSKLTLCGIGDGNIIDFKKVKLISSVNMYIPYWNKYIILPWYAKDLTIVVILSIIVFLRKKSLKIIKLELIIRMLRCQTVNMI